MRSDTASPLSAERILDAALRLVDEQGFAALTMRRLTTRLSIDPMAVYYYIPTKKQLVQGLVRSAFAEMKQPSSSGDWRVRVHAWADAYRAMAMAHPNLILQMLTNLDAVEAALLANQSLHSALEAGLAKNLAYEGEGVLVDFVHGYLLAQPTASQHDQGHDAAYFRFGLDTILDGLEKRAVS
jgi:TetR/AcrR family tetracycline transcriptional repressor